MRFLTRTLRNILYVCVGKRSLCLHCSLVAFVALANCRLRRLAVRRKLEDAYYYRRWCWSHALCTRPQVHKPNYQLEPATYAGVILPKSGQFLLLCSLQLWQQLQHCHQTLARVPLFLIHITSILRKQFTAKDMFLQKFRNFTESIPVCCIEGKPNIQVSLRILR